MRKLLPLFAVLLFMPGCSKPTPDQIVAIIDATLPIATQGILTQFAKKHAVSGKIVAQEISDACKNDAIPLVLNGSLPANALIDQIQTIIASKTHSDLESGIAAIISTIASIGGINLHAPKMTANEQRYLLAGLNAIASGCDAFLKNRMLSLYGESERRIVESESENTNDVVELDCEVRR